MKSPYAGMVGLSSQIAEIEVFSADLGAIKEVLKGIVLANGYRLAKRQERNMVRAIKGHRWFGLLHFVPLLNLVPLFQRMAIECELHKTRKGYHLEFEATPYMELFNEEEMPLLSANLFETVLDTIIAKRERKRFLVSLKRSSLRTKIISTC